MAWKLRKRNQISRSTIFRKWDNNMNWIGIVFLYTFGGEILYGMRQDLFIDEEECRSHYESLDNWNYVGKHCRKNK